MMQCWQMRLFLFSYINFYVHYVTYFLCLMDRDIKSDIMRCSQSQLALLVTFYHRVFYGCILNNNRVDSILIRRQKQAFFFFYFLYFFLCTRADIEKNGTKSSNDQISSLQRERESAGPHGQD